MAVMVYTVWPAPVFSAKSIPVVDEVITGAVSSRSVMENVTVVESLVLLAASLAVTVKL